MSPSPIVALRRRALPLCCGPLAAALLLGCGSAEWPPPPRNAQETLVLEAALKAVEQIDGWSQTACVIERSGAQWHVQAWKIVNPSARGRRKCVPWAVRSITIDQNATVTEYRNSR